MRLRNDRCVERQKEAIERNAKWAAMTTAAKLMSLDARLGGNVGAKRQRERLSK